MTNPYCNCGHMRHQHQDSFGECGVRGCDCKGVNNNEIEQIEDEPQESNLVIHARRELALLENDESFNNSVIEMVKIFAAQGHSGSSAAYAANLIGDLLRYRPLRPLTDDPDEWVHHSAEFWDGKNGVWQNKRDSRAFSNDEGNTYWLVDEQRVNKHKTDPSPKGAAAAAKRQAEKLRKQAEEVSAPYDR